MKGVHFGAGRDLESRVTTNLFIICANNSGSTFLKNALATSRRTWNLTVEGQFMFGFAGPDTRTHGRLLWGADPRWRGILADEDAYDWPRNRHVWYFQASAREPAATVFTTKAPPFLLHVEALNRHFRNAKFLFMVRNPYAVCEGIWRYRQDQPAPPGRRLFEAAAEHVAYCLERQRRNLETHAHLGAFFTYEAMCDQPERVERQIRSLVPEIDDLELRRRLRVKGLYDEMLTNMNARQIARLTPAQLAVANRVFEKHREVLEHFGYSLMATGRGARIRRGNQGIVRRLRRRIGTHLFIICPNNSGSSFLKEALAACRNTWNLYLEGHGMPGFVGPPTVWKPAPGEPSARWIWASRQGWMDALRNPDAYDWPRTREAWYSAAYARDPAATVFVTKSPPFLLYVDELLRHFPDARFLFMVRNPYAVCEGICRRYRESFPSGGRERFETPAGDLEEAAATHVANCLRWQRRNVEAHGERGILLTYEAMCADPADTERRIRALVPALDDLNLRRRHAVKEYDEVLTDMNARQIERLDAARIAAFDRVFASRRGDLGYFGYGLMEEAGAPGVERTQGRDRTARARLHDGPSPTARPSLRGEPDEG